MKKKKSSSKMVLESPEIPLDLQIEILNRLPIKSLARFKCVSKLWSSFISSKGYFFALPPCLYVISVDMDYNPVKFVLLSLTSTSKSSTTALDINMTKKRMERYGLVVLRVLILYTIGGQACIYNTTTRQRVILPTIKFNILTGQKVIIHDYFLGYDPVLDQYKVVCVVVTMSAHLPSRIYSQNWWVFVLEERSSWKRIEFDQPHIPIPTKGGFCINGVIYNLTSRPLSIIISFDVRSEEFNMIQIPNVVNSWHLELIEYDGKLTIFDFIHLRIGLLNLWVLEDDGIWSKKSLVLRPCQMHFFPNSIDFEVLGITQNGEVILKPKNIVFPYYILYYDLHKNDVRRVDIRGISEEPFLLAQMDTGESIMHLKT